MQYSGISKDSRDIKPGYIYFCYDGKKSGYDFIDEAKEKGAIKIVGEKNIDIDLYEKVPNVNEAMIKYAQELYDNPQDKVNLIGVTGTDGKTSTALIIDQFLNKLSTSSYLGTNGFFLKGKEFEYTGFTTPFADKFYENLNLVSQEKIKNFVMEVSSHALEQNRLGDVEFKVALFTNLTPEHLDYHKTIEDYYLAKKKLMEKTNDESYLIINIDDIYGKRLASEMSEQKKRVITVGKDLKSDFIIKEINSNLEGTNFTFFDRKNLKEHNVSSPLLGEFNVYNLLQSILSVHYLGYELEEIEELIRDISVPGRMERIQRGTSPNIIIDFAHTANAIEKVVEFVKPLHRISKPKGKLITVTGSAGDRDHLKRASMGQAATNGVDIFYMTEDDPRHEDVHAINNQIRKGIENSNCEVFEIDDRKKLIKEVIMKYNSDDTIIFFGKGEMKVMYYDGYNEPYYEKEEIEKAIDRKLEK